MRNSFLVHNFFTFLVGDGDEKIPTEEEQDIAQKYVMERSLERPDTNVFTAIIFLLGFVIMNAGITGILYFLFRKGIFSSIPPGLIKFGSTHPWLAFDQVFSLCCFISLLFSLKIWIIGAVKLYQRYAPEEVRRRCMYMPTCSEYMILAVQKYGAFKGLIKGWDRVYNRCVGNIYRIDYP